jgi:carbon monoxide dehydrogenase subunit G
VELRNTFAIDVPIDHAWRVLNTPETVAPCFPGATLAEYEGDRFAGTVKIKLGPISMLFRGTGTYVSRDEDAHRVVIEASGRDSRGNGSARATVTGSMEPDGPDRTVVTLVTDLKVTGRPAQLGRGVITDVADRIIGQFAACVADRLGPAADSPAGQAEAAAPPPATPELTTTAPSPALRPADPLPADAGRPVDLLALLGIGTPTAKRAVALTTAALIVLAAFLVRHSRTR